MPVFIYEHDAFEKIVQIEGETYRQPLCHHAGSDCSFEAFQKEWKKLGGGNPDWTEIDCESISTKQSGAIYGLGGWHRYIVRNTGEIMFSEGHCGLFSSGGCRPHKDPRKIGFRIFPDDLPRE